ncbi:MAG: hypothetical protein ABIR97_03615 [Terracoccus sp.]
MQPGAVALENGVLTKAPVGEAPRLVEEGFSVTHEGQLRVDQRPAHACDEKIGDLALHRGAVRGEACPTGVVPSRGRSTLEQSRNAADISTGRRRQRSQDGTGLRKWLHAATLPPKECTAHPSHDFNGICEWVGASA